MRVEITDKPVRFIFLAIRDMARVVSYLMEGVEPDRRDGFKVQYFKLSGSGAAVLYRQHPFTSEEVRVVANLIHGAATHRNYFKAQEGFIEKSAGFQNLVQVKTWWNTEGRKLLYERKKKKTVMWEDVHEEEKYNNRLPLSVVWYGRVARFIYDMETGKISVVLSSCHNPDGTIFAAGTDCCKDVAPDSVKPVWNSAGTKEVFYGIVYSDESTVFMTEDQFQAIRRDICSK